MPYRRTGRAYRRRSPSRPTMWVRNVAYDTDRTNWNAIWMADLLAPLHTGQSQLKVGGAYEAAPSGVGKTVVRIHLGLRLFYHIDDPATQFMWNDGAYIGIRVDTWPHDSEVHTIDPTPPSTDPSLWDPKEGANTEDWLFWQYVSALDDKYVDSTSDVTGTGTDRVYAREFDVRSKRRIRDLGDSLVLCIRPDGSDTQGIDMIHCNSSVLLR